MLSIFFTIFIFWPHTIWGENGFSVGGLTFQNVFSDISIHIANNQYVDSADIDNKWYAVETLILLPNMGIVYINSIP